MEMKRREKKNYRGVQKTEQKDSEDEQNSKDKVSETA